MLEIGCMETSENIEFFWRYVNDFHSAYWDDFDIIYQGYGKDQFS